jgi:hypothetical protein
LNARHRSWLLSILLAALVVGVAGWSTAATASAATRVLPGAPVVPTPPSSLIATTTAPSWCGLDAQPLSVRLCWVDKSTDEQSFKVYRRGTNGWYLYTVYGTRSSSGVGDQYSVTDYDTGVSGQCYMIAAVASGEDPGYSSEQCTVRPDPNLFPQTPPSAALQWNGLSSLYDGTGDLYNRQRGESLTWAGQSSGVDLGFSSSRALWKIEPFIDSPHVMFGQVVALRVWGGGWLTYDNINDQLVLADTPSYEWYVLSGSQPPGTLIDARPASQTQGFALWDNHAKAYLLSRFPTVGLGTISTADTSVYMTAQPPVEGYVPFLGYFGGGPGNTSTLTKVSNPFNGVTLFFPKPGHGSQDCGTASDVVTLLPGTTMSAADMQTLWGSPTPSLAQPLPFLACAATQGSLVAVNVEYTDIEYLDH